MAYVIFDKDVALNLDNGFSKIAADATSRDKVAPSHLAQFYKIYEVSDTDYNGLRLGTKRCKHDGTNITFWDDNLNPLEGQTESNLTEAVVLKRVADYTDTIRKYCENSKISEDAKTDWLNYADSVDALDYSSFTGRSINNIIESKNITFRSLSELPVV